MPTTEKTSPSHEQPKPNTGEEQEPKKQQEHEKLDEKNKYGGRSEKPDGDVNPAQDMHIDEDEDEKPAHTEHHDALNRKDRDDPRNN
ncbi:hypothetical protein ABFZ85_03040 [Hyphococcus formosus]|uniref:hypothetical protein n=1 Tax=Hyphococcus formosus TaxID=3143534 RepID=UPI00398A9150